MSLTPSVMPALGSKAPAFRLLNTVDGQMVSLDDFKKDDVLVVMFICNHCPYVKHINQALVKVVHDFDSQKVGWVAISSNDVVNYPDDSPAKMKEHARKEGYPFVYLYDEDQSVAKAYQAACTPDFFVYDKDRKLTYAGRFDASSPGQNTAVTGEDLGQAIRCALESRALSFVPKASMGCNIKWKKNK